MSALRNSVILGAAFVLSCGVGAISKPKIAAGPQPAAKKAAPKAEPAKAAAAEKAEAPYTGAPVLEPSQFPGMAAMGYAAAKAAPGVMSKIFCYCGCDLSDNHSALIDCYTGMHGTDCHICQEESVLALRLHRDGATIPEIQKRIDADYAHYYPFETKSDALKKYEAMRDGKESAPGLTSEKPKVKPGMTVGSCCAEHEKKK